MGDEKKETGNLVKFDGKKKPKKIKIPDSNTKEVAKAEPQEKRTVAAQKIEKFRDSFFNPEKVDGKLPEYHESNLSRAHVLQALDTVRDFISSGGSLDEEVKSKINDLLEDHSNRLKMFLIGVSHVRVNNLTTLLRDIDRIERELSSRNMEVLNTNQLLAYYNSLSAREQGLVNYLKELTEVTLPGRVETDSDQEKAAKLLEEAGVTTPNVAARRNVRDLLDKIARELSRREKNASRKLLNSGEPETTK